MADIDISQFRKLYLTTALEYAQKIEDQLKALLLSPSPDAVNEIFIAAHSLKSQSLIMGYTSLADAALSLEKVYRACKENATVVPKDIVDGSSVLLVSISASLQQILANQQEADITDATSTFKKIAGLG